MEDNELQKIWKSIDSKIESKSEGELRNILEDKTRKTMRKFYISSIVIFIVTAGFFTFLAISLINRWDDIYYRINNLFIAVITLVALISEILTIRLLRKNRSAYSLKEWIEKSIAHIHKELYQRISYYILPIIAIPSILSIHVYFSHNAFLDIFKDEESIYGLIFGFIVGMIVAYIFIYRYRKYQRRNLEYLEGLYERL